MRILAIDSSATAASVALVEDGKVLGEFYINTKLTHSQTLMPMIDNVLKCMRADLQSVDLFAVSSGPGSFTGIRIGIASVKGLAMAQDKPCVGVSTLEAMARNLEH
ncbi:MAG: tRNA (adenosine(37)-N6)-threonylcarbamoyltransferase complex dimerization subunit type 1 TsaB, partial [Clostridiales bacterium]|nr:tRNA (adenosine(37)-N6)-threonylcarbamoyltransferase complex dimerization subunit type 1 TsaB [Clostridiales bacterium]